ncbi:MAG: CDP-alcohol phosphatidyltransferase family protein [Alphaproteobacteria bacterium]|nr:CDP-alcohol phosphatidyltransferase family protein [Alphaproteobacteria bacterium]
MLDATLRPLIDVPLNAVGRRMSGVGISANTVTVAGFAIGICAVPAMGLGLGWIAFLCLVLNRLADGLDGAIARQRGPTDLGGYLDIVLDFIFYSAVVLGAGLARPDLAIWAAFLIFSFIGTGASFLGFAIVAAKRRIETDAQGRKSIFYIGGLAEGTETIIALAILTLRPDWLPWVAGIFGAMCWITTAFRIGEAVRIFSGEQT